MMPRSAEATREGAVVVLGGTSLVIAIMALFKARPAQAAPPEEKIDHIISLLELGTVELSTVIDLLGKILAAQAGIGVTVQTPWVAREPELLLQQDIRAAGTITADKIVDWTEGKRMVIKVESSLDQAVQIQVVGNHTNTYQLATDINALLPCPPNASISVGMAWDDWHPFIGVRITVAVAPTAGILSIWAVVQE